MYRFISVSLPKPVKVSSASAPSGAEELVAPVKAAHPEPITGWIPARLEGGVWGARFQGDTRYLPTDLEGLTIAVQSSLIFGWFLLGYAKCSSN